MKAFISRYGVYLLAIVVFIASAAVYCSPSLSGKIVSGDDNGAFIGASGESARYAAKTQGKGAWWTGSMFCGMPTYQIGGGATFKAVKWLAPINSVLHKGISNPIWTMFLYFACFYIMLLAFGISPWISLLGALTIGLSSYFITLIPAGHSTKTATIALTAVVVAGYKLIFDKKYIPGAILTMVFVASGYSLHPQMFYYYFMMIALLWMAELWRHFKEKRWKDLVVATAVFLFAVGIGVGTGCSKLLVNREYLKESTRGGSVLKSYLDSQNACDGPSDNVSSKGLNLDYITEWSYGVDETFSLLIPGFKGGSTYCALDPDSQFIKTAEKHGYSMDRTQYPLYWGNQPFTYGNTYVGAIVCFLFILGLFIVKGPYKWMLFACTLFSICLSWGGGFPWLTKLFYNYFPMYGKFRAVSSILIVAEIAMPLLGFLGVKEIMDGRVEKGKLFRSVYTSAGILIGICLFFAFAGSFLYSFDAPGNEYVESMPGWAKSAFIDQRRAILRGDCLRSSLLILSAAFLIVFQQKLNKKALPLFMLVGILSVVDLWGVDRRYFNDDSFTSVKRVVSGFKMKDYEKELLKDKDPHFRVYNTTTDTFNESRTSFYLKSVGGYSAAKLSRYDDLINVHLKKNHEAVFGMLNTKYVIVPGETFPENGDDVLVLPNEGALGNAWFVNDVMWVDNPKDEIELIDRCNLRDVAVVNDEFKEPLDGRIFSKSVDSRIILEKYAPDHLEYYSTSSSTGLAIFSEIYYPYGWVARIDGKEQPHFRANYLLRALVIPEGTHTVTFDFNPRSVKIGDGIALFFVVVMYLCVAAALVYGLRKPFSLKS